MSKELDELSKKWAFLKETETNAARSRREIEDRMVEIMDLPEDTKGSKSISDTLSANYTITEKVDSDKLQELAAANNLDYQLLGKVCIWKASLNRRAWEAASDELKDALAPAITRKPGRPTFAIKKKKANK